MYHAQAYRLCASPAKSIAIALVSLAFALFAISFEALEITDRSRYVVHIAAADVIVFRYLPEGVLTYLVNEPLWKLLNYALNLAFDNPLDAIKCYVFVASFVSAYIVLSHDSRYFLLLLAFILLPQFLKNYIAHLRQGVAISVFLIGWLGFTGRWRIFIIMLTPFIHSSFFFLLVILGIQKALSYISITIAPRMILYAIIIGAMSLASLVLAEALGARQTSYEYFGADISGKGFVFWLAIFSLFASQGGAFIQKHLLAMSVLLFYLVSYTFLPVAARIFESGIILVLLASLSLSPGRFLLFLPAFFLFFFMQWLPRIGVEGLGWMGTLG
ncbi:hypothetical protein [Halomonas marinisediminis]|uniref:EpsG family protein n=1 Tax=Halomonas marinisediminis TaxID=2546095 RepID=A0ABY2D3C6_9GAMM|nr:hypothetical protein [Halomonas marinisediminis]TDA95747.1 hypothetical protein E0702_15095 [Halomonas marinisediminis]